MELGRRGELGGGGSEVRRHGLDSSCGFKSVFRFVSRPAGTGTPITRAGESVQGLEVKSRSYSSKYSDSLRVLAETSAPRCSPPPELLDQIALNQNPASKNL